MKKTILAILVVLLLVGLFAFSAFGEEAAAETTVTFAPYKAEDGTRQYCACGNAFVVEDGTTKYVNGEDGCKKHTNEDGTVVGCDGTILEWLPIAGEMSLKTLKPGAYYLSGALSVTAQAVGNNTGGVYYFDLNGFSWTTKSATLRAFTTYYDKNKPAGTCYSITDTSASQTGSIAGNGTAQGVTMWFPVNYGCTLTLYSGTIDGSQKDCTHTSGGAAIWAGSDTTINVLGGTIKSGNSTTAYGGIVINGTFNMYGGEIIGGNGVNGGAIYITSSAALNVYDGIITGGVATSNGGAIYNTGAVNIMGGQITGGQATVDGGNIAGSGTLNISGGTISSGQAGSDGGNLYVKGLTMTGGKIIEGIATERGGNIYSYTNAASFSSGTVSNGNAGTIGGNLFAVSSAVAISENAIVTGGTSKTGGGNIYTGGTLNITGGTVSHGVVTNGGGGNLLVDDGGNVTISGGTFSYGNTSTQGGSMRTEDGSTVTITGGTFEYGGINAASKEVTTTQGGNLAIIGGTVSITGGTFTGGQTKEYGGNIRNSKELTLCADVVVEKGQSQNGGNISNNSGGTLIIDGATIRDGIASADGGNIFANKSLTINSGSTIENGKATGRGGNIFVNTANAPVTVNGGQIADGYAGGIGGNIASYGSITLNDGTFTGGSGTSGGNIYLYASVTKASTTTTDESGVETVTDYIKSSNAAKLYMHGGKITQGIARTGNGGNIYSNIPSTTLTVKENGTQTDSWTETVPDKSEVHIFGGEISYGKTLNTSKDGHGGNMFARGKVFITGGSILGGETTYGYGGSLYCAYTAEISNAVITGGSAANRGGALYLTNEATISDTTISGSGKQGGAVYISSSGKVTMTGTTLQDSTATTGGGIYLFGELTMDASTVSDCSAGAGGSLYMGGGTLNIQEGTQITGGKSTGDHGGNLYIDGGTINMTGGTISGGDSITDNTASNRSGGNMTLEGACTFNMTGGTVTAGKAHEGGNFRVSPEAVLNISGDALIEKGSAANGGNILNYGAVNMNGGTVTEGNATSNGGNVQAHRSFTDGYQGLFVLNSGTISNGTAGSRGGNIYNAGYKGLVGYLRINGGSVIDGSASNGDNIFVSTLGNTTITGGTITGGAENDIYVLSGDDGSVLTLENAPVIGSLYVNNMENYQVNVIKLDCDQQIALDGTYAKEFAAAASEKATVYFDYVDGVVGYKNGQLYMAKAVAGVPFATASLPAGDYEYYLVSDIGGKTISLADANAAVVYNGTTYTANEDGEVELDVLIAGSADGVLLQISNTGEDAETYTVTEVTAPVMDVYVSDSGSDDNAGTADEPFLTLEKAVAVVSDGGTVHIVDSLTRTEQNWPTTDKVLTVTGGTVDLTAQKIQRLRSQLTFENLTMVFADDGHLFAYGNKLVIGENVTMPTLITVYGGSSSDCDGTDVTILSGQYKNIYGGGNQADVNGDIHLYVGGNVNEGLDEMNHDLNRNVSGGCRQGNVTGSIYMTFADNAEANNVRGGNVSNAASRDDGTNYTVGGDIYLTCTGGSGMGIYGGSTYSDSQCDIYFTYAGGNFEQVFGAATGSGHTGNIELRAIGGRIQRRIYGGAYNEVSAGLFTADWSTSYQVNGNITLYLGGDVNIDFSTSYNDESIYAHSRYGNVSGDSIENSTLIFLDAAAYNTYKNKLEAQDLSMKGIASFSTAMDDAADNLHYHSYSASGNTITYSCAYNSSETGTAVVNVPADADLTYAGQPVTPAAITYTNWIGDELEVSYANNNAPGNATATVTVNGVSASIGFTITGDSVEVSVNGTVASYDSLQAAIDAAGEGALVQLLADCGQDITISGTLYLDLNGFDLTGKVTVTGTLYGMDSTTNDYDCSDGYGKISNLVGSCEIHHKTSVTGKILRYLTVNEDGVISFHRIYLGITKVNLKPGTVGFGYKAVFGGDQKVQEALGEQEAFGYSLWLEGGNATAVYKGSSHFVSGKTVTLRLDNFDIANFGGTKVHATVCLKLADGNVITSEEYAYSMKDMLKLVDRDLSAYSDAQVALIRQLYLDHAETMSGWGLTNISKEEN